MSWQYQSSECVCVSEFLGACGNSNCTCTCVDVTNNNTQYYGNIGGCMGFGDFVLNYEDQQECQSMCGAYCTLMNPGTGQTCFDCSCYGSFAIPDSTPSGGWVEGCYNAGNKKLLPSEVIDFIESVL